MEKTLGNEVPCCNVQGKESFGFCKTKAALKTITVHTICLKPIASLTVHTTSGRHPPAGPSARQWDTAGTRKQRSNWPPCHQGRSPSFLQGAVTAGSFPGRPQHVAAQSSDILSECVAAGDPPQTSCMACPSGAPQRQNRVEWLHCWGSNGEVEAVALLEDLLGTESWFHVREPPRRVVRPEGRQGDVGSVCHHVKICSC